MNLVWKIISGENNVDKLDVLQMELWGPYK